jgi:hypothetical protein
MAFKLTNIKLKTSRLQAIAAVKKYFNLYNIPVTESVAKLDQILRDGITVEYMFQVDNFERLDTFTYEIQEVLNEYDRWEVEQNKKLSIARMWYGGLTTEEQEFVNLLRGEMIPRA